LSGRKKRKGRQRHDSRPTAPQQQVHPANPVTVSVQSQPATAPSEAMGAEKEAPNNYERRIANWTVVVGAFTVILAFATVGSDYVLWKTDHTLKEVMQIDQRAWIGIESIMPIPLIPEKGKTFAASVKMRNTGKTPARNIRQIGSLDPIKGDPVATYNGTPKLAGNLSPNAEGAIPFTPLKDGTGQPLLLNEDVMKRLQNGDFKIVVHGRIDYEDVFGDPHWTTYCATLAVPFNGQFEFCEGQNDTDDYSPQK